LLGDTDRESETETVLTKGLLYSIANSTAASSEASSRLAAESQLEERKEAEPSAAAKAKGGADYGIHGSGFAPMEFTSRQ